MQCLILLYCSLISSVLVIISADSSDSCFLPKTEDYSGQLSPDDLVREVFDFNDNYDQRFKELKKFIKANQSHVDELDINYLLYTARNPKSNYTLKPTVKSLRKSYFNPSLPTAIIVDGFIQKFGVSNSPIGVIKDKMIERDQYNIIFVDYVSQNQEGYFQGVKNSYLVSQNIAHFVDFLLKNTPVTAQQLHLIGISFGAQVAGNAGSLIPGLGRITALDAAAGIFTELPKNYRLSYDDANFVDVIHTGDLPFPKGVGFFPPIGHQNFYVNGGLNQPGCMDKENESGDPVIDLTNAVCKHQRSLFLFIASFCVDCQFIGVKCNSYKNFQKGICTPENSVVAIMGIDATPNPSLPPRSKLYLNTTGSFPFCQMSK